MYALNAEILCMNQISFRPQAEILQRYLMCKTKNLLRSAAHNVVILSFTGLKPAAAGIFSISLPTDGLLRVPSPRRVFPAFPVLYDGRFSSPRLACMRLSSMIILYSFVISATERLQSAGFLIIVHNATKNTRIFRRVFLDCNPTKQLWQTDSYTSLHSSRLSPSARHGFPAPPRRRPLRKESCLHHGW